MSTAALDREICQKMNNVPFELKELGQNGEFTGLASPYGNVDLGGDVAEKGMFAKSLSERGNKVRLLDSHDVRIGIADVRDTPEGLEAKGQINLDKQAGRDAYSDLKFYRDKGLPMGLSIGYKTVKSDFDGKGVRHLQEVNLWEISITEFPMNTRALVTEVKSVETKKVKYLVTDSDGTTHLPYTDEEGNPDHRLMGAAWAALHEGYRGNKYDGPGKDAALEKLKSVYKSEGMDLPDSGKSAEPPERKVGRMISAANEECIKSARESIKSAHKHMQNAHDLLSSLIDQEAGEDATSEDQQPGEYKTEPERVHSAAKILSDIRSLIPQA